MFQAAKHTDSLISGSSDEFNLHHVCLRMRISFTVTVSIFHTVSQSSTSIKRYSNYKCVITKVMHVEYTRVVL